MTVAYSCLHECIIFSSGGKAAYLRERQNMAVVFVNGHAKHKGSEGNGGENVSDLVCDMRALFVSHSVLKVLTCVVRGTKMPL